MGGDMRNVQIVFFASLTLCGAALAEPPPGHPSVDQAQQAMELPDNEPLTYRGQVLQVIPSNDYTYLEVSTGEGKKLWLAAPRTEVAPQAWIRYGNGTVMHNFFSRKHQRTFDEVMFVERIAVDGN